jgi:hypothetical protein
LKTDLLDVAEVATRDTERTAETRDTEFFPAVKGKNGFARSIMWVKPENVGAIAM